MPKPFWKGAISFGMVAIPVRMSIATQSKKPSFRFLHRKCHTRPKQVLYCSKDDEYISRADTVRGYEYARNQFVVFEDEDFEKVPVKTSHSIDIKGFARIEEIDPIYYEGSHYLEPEEMGLKPFLMLRNILEKKELAGIAKVAFQRREHLCCLRPFEKIMALHTINYQENILSPEDMSPKEVGLDDAEMDMAAKLVDAMTTGFQPEKYHDEYAVALQELVEAKLQGIEPEVPEEPKAEIKDLMAALRASVEAATRSQ